ncbi:hypothetical protein RhiJN_27001 [Ceratobasidium sp. AG-Ba]|nr:hypothetical protein RhiJN_27001 [Ceratobasidium sp. AG-Ba]
MDDPATIVCSRRIAKALMPESYEMDPIGAGESVLDKWDALLIDYYGLKLPWMDRILDTCASILMIEDGNNLELECDIDDVELDDEVYEEVFNEIAKDTPWFPKLYSIIMENSGPYPVEQSLQEPRDDFYASDHDVDMQEGKSTAEYVAAARLTNPPPAPAAQSSSSTPKV